MLFFSANPIKGDVARQVCASYNGPGIWSRREITGVMKVLRVTCLYELFEANTGDDGCLCYEGALGQTITVPGSQQH